MNYIIRTFRVLFFLFLGAASSLVQADEETEKLLALLRKEYPQITVSSVDHSPMAGLYEVVVNKQLLYTDKAGRVFITGTMYDMQTKEDLSADRRQTLSRVDVANLPIAHAFKHVFGTGVHTLYMFSDPDCPYCRRLQAEVEKLQDVTLFVFLFPLSELHSDARRKSESIWCSGDDNARWALWHSITMNGATPPTLTCNNPIDTNVTLAIASGIRGTPSLIAADGRVMSGAASVDKIDHWLRAGSDKP